MKRPTFALVLAAALLVALVWLLWPRHDDEPAPAGFAAVNRTSGVPAKLPFASRPIATSPPSAPSEISHLADNLNSPTGNVTADLRIVADVLENFRTNFPHDGNPVGSNAEITAALTGKNKLRYAAIPPNHPAINRAGELCDRWSTPFFFHAESGSRMGIRSAGPDKKMWTADDVELAP